jgi:hypothetical protein
MPLLRGSPRPATGTASSSKDPNNDLPLEENGHRLLDPRKQQISSCGTRLQSVLDK